jgi:hypothetical protein
MWDCAILAAMQPPPAHPSKAGQTTPAPAPDAVLFEMLAGFMKAKAVQVAAELGIADLVGDGSRSVAELAAATGSNEGALHRLLRALASNGVFREVALGRFENTATSTLIRSEVADSIRDYALYVPNDFNMKAWMQFADVVKTGVPSFVAANGCGLFELLQRDATFARAFSRAMASMSGPHITAVLGAYDFSSCGNIIDVGGGYGHVVASVLKKNASLRGAIFDLPVLADKARELLAAHGLLERCAILSGDFFVEVPDRYDTYLMKHILHDWDDPSALRILKNCRASMKPGSYSCSRLRCARATIPIRQNGSICR